MLGYFEMIPSNLTFHPVKKQWGPDQIHPDHMFQLKTKKLQDLSWRSPYPPVN